MVIMSEASNHVLICSEIEPLTKMLIGIGFWKCIWAFIYTNMHVLFIHLFLKINTNTNREEMHRRLRLHQRWWVFNLELGCKKFPVLASRPGAPRPLHSYPRVEEEGGTCPETRYLIPQIAWVHVESNITKANSN